jgi:hypothetical protein
MSGSPSKFDALFDALMSLPNREDYPEVMGAEDVSRATGLALKVVTAGAGMARALVERLIESEAEKIFAGKATRLERDITMGLLERARSRMVPGKFPAAVAVMALLEPGFIPRAYPKIVDRVVALREHMRRSEEAHDRYWSARLNRPRKAATGKKWKTVAEPPRGRRPTLCVVFNEPYGFIRLAYWVGAVGQWWFLASDDEIEVTHWCPVPEPPGGWLEPGSELVKKPLAGYTKGVESQEASTGGRS